MNEEEYLLDKIDVMIENSIKTGRSINEDTTIQKEKINNSKKSVNNDNNNDSRHDMV